jgi:PD-(D/E)XK endonuclease
VLGQGRERSFEARSVRPRCEHSFVLSSNQKGAIAEAEIAAAAIRIGVTVLKPLAEHGRYDLAFEIAPRLLRVQCKWAALAPDRSVITIRTGGSRCTPNGYVLSAYAETDIDLLAAYCAELDRCYLLPASLVAGRRQIYLRLMRPRNGQQACINMAGDYEFAGAVAQLGERVSGTHEVTGSSPVSSTSVAPSDALELGAHDFRERFGHYMELAAAGRQILIRRHGRAFARLCPA